MMKFLLSTAVLLAASLQLAAAEGDPKKGEALFIDNCSACHEAASTEARVGPGLKGLFKKEKLVTGKPPSDENVRSIINDGTSAMPPMGSAFKDEPEKDHVITYLKTL